MACAVKTRLSGSCLPGVWGSFSQIDCGRCVPGSVSIQCSRAVLETKQVVNVEDVERRKQTSAEDDESPAMVEGSGHGAVVTALPLLYLGRECQAERPRTLRKRLRNRLLSLK